MFIVILFLREHPTEAEYTDCHKDVGKTKAEIKHRFITHTQNHHNTEQYNSDSLQLPFQSDCPLFHNP